MKSLQNQMIWHVLLLTIVLFWCASYIFVYLVEKKTASELPQYIEYIRDTKYKSLNKDNLKTAYDFTSLNFTSYIIDKNGQALFGIKYSAPQDVQELCNASQDVTQTLDRQGLKKIISLKKNGDLCFVVEGNYNTSIIVGEFAWQIFQYLIVFLVIVLGGFLYMSYRRVYKPIKIVKENNEQAVVSKWDGIQKSSTKIKELEDLERFSSYVIELLKQKSGESSNTNATLEIQNIQSKYITTKASNDVNKFKLATDATPNLVTIVDIHGYVNYINKSVTELTGITFDMAENKRLTDLWHKGEDVSLWKKNIDDAIKRRSSLHVSGIGQRKGGVTYESDITITPIINKDGIADNVLIIERDVTEEKQKDRIKSEFISVVSHELRTPMTVIRGYSTLLAEGKLGELNEKQKDYITKINTTTGHLLELANDMLDLQKFESGKIELKMEKQNIVETIKRTVEMNVDVYKQKKLGLSFENNSEKADVMVDLKYFERILSNLLSNAYKYTEKGEIKVFLLNPDKEHVVLAVKDTGVGINEAALPHLFERFFQADGVMARKQEGSGLGLSIVKKVVEAHNGMVWVESTVGVGSTFYVALPLA